MNATRPANPAEISFAPECFVQVGVDITYEWPYTFNHHGFSTACKATADKLARKWCKPYTVKETPILKRIKWTA